MFRPRSLSWTAAAVHVLVLLPFAGCSSNPKEPKGPSPAGAPSTDAQQPPDAVVLTSKEVVRGRITNIDGFNLTVKDEDGYFRTITRGAVYTIKYGSEESYARWNAPPLAPAPAHAVHSPASSWFPRSDPNQAVQPTLIDWFTGHEMNECVGEKLAKTHADHKDLMLFLPPGGKLVLYDRRNLGFHAHTWPTGYHKPIDKPEIAIPVPDKEEAIPQAIAFVSSSLEMKTNDGTKDHKSYALSAIISAVLKPLSASEAYLTAQTFAGGKPAAGTNGPIWAAALPRNDREWYLYVLDGPERPHAKLLQASYVGIGDAVLDSNAIIEVQAPDGAAIGRVFVLPYPDPQAVAPEAPVVLYTGARTDPTPIASVALPPRYTIMTPQKPPATKADVWVHYHDVSKDIPEQVFIGTGTGAPTATDVRIIDRPLVPDQADEKVSIDLGSRAEEEFPLVCWFHSRRSYLWREPKGFLPRGNPLPLLPTAGPTKLTRVIMSPPVPHVLPILFVGNRPAAAVMRGADPAAGLATGMSNAVMQDALAREAGRGLTNLTSSLAPTMNAIPGGGTGAYQNVTNVTLVVPSQAGVGGLGSTPAYVTPPAGVFMPTQGPPNLASAFANPGVRPAGFVDQTDGTYYNSQGQKVWDPTSPTSSYSNWYHGGGGQASGGAPGISIGVPVGLGQSMNIPVQRQNRR